MSVRAIVSAALYKVDFRTSRNGNPFAIFTLRENVNGVTRWWQAISFSETAIETLKEMAAGEPIAVSGTVDAEIYAPAGSDSRINWRVTVDSVLSAAKAKHKRKERSAEHPAPARNVPADGRSIAAASWAAPEGGGAR